MMNHLAVLLTEIWRGRLNTHACNAPFLEQMPEDHACELSPWIHWMSSMFCSPVPACMCP